MGGLCGRTWESDYESSHDEKEFLDERLFPWSMFLSC